MLILALFIVMLLLAVPVGFVLALVSVICLYTSGAAAPVAVPLVNA